ncbi:MAG: nascent polypeptide-associated complex protein [Candidatus Aenigmatarchaeota archaeon]
MIDPKQLQKLMQQMGIKTSEINSKRVIIETEGEKIILKEPKVLLIEAKGEKTYQITSNIIDVVPNINEEDIKLVMEKTNASKEECEKALIECKGDIAEAILKLSK